MNLTLRKKRALAGNRTRVARVASEHSTTEPPVLASHPPNYHNDQTTIDLLSVWPIDRTQTIDGVVYQRSTTR